MKLIVMRHGEAEAYNTEDETRSLTRFGKTQASFAGRRLSEYLQNDLQKPIIELALVSPYLRTQQTFQEVSKKIQIGRKLDTDLITPEADISQATDYIQGLTLGSDCPENLLLVSHMPFVSLFSDAICSGFNARIFSTADILVIDYDVDSQQGTQLALIQSIS
ncbi:phosphohistidine phosphatase SixA [Glaciecola sp. 1036]|uniref:phosphohistidine phosphatase SixA n=1 Tax=Alteromonadaceae TaxID=72275 RepID=UPI003D06198F